MGAVKILSFLNDIQNGKFSPDGTKIYSDNGILDTATGTYLGLLPRQPLGTYDITSDGRYLLSAKAVPGAASGNSRMFTLQVDKIDLTTNAVTTAQTTFISANVTASSYVTAALSPSTLILTPQLGSGLPAYVFDLDQGSFSQIAMANGGYESLVHPAGQGPVLAVSRAPGALAVLDQSGVAIATHAAGQDGITGFGRSETISAAGNLVAQYTTTQFNTDPQLDIYDLQLHFLGNILPTIAGQIGSSDLDGIILSPDGSHLYAVNGETRTLYDFSTSDWHLVRSYALGHPTGYVFSMDITPDGRYLDVGSSLIDLSQSGQVDGTSGADQLIGTSDIQILYGYGGNDIFRDGTAPDTMVGGDGDDTYYVTYAGAFMSTIVERPGGGNDTVVTPLALTAPDNVETLVLAQGVLATITANSAGTRLIGNDYGTLLQGGTGDDILIGGLGDDVLDGWAGTDIAVINDSLASSSILVTPGNLPPNATLDTYRVTSADGIDTLTRISIIRFNDQDLPTSYLKPVESVFVDVLGRHSTLAEQAALYPSIQGITAYLQQPSNYATPRVTPELRQAILTAPSIRPQLDATIDAYYQMYAGRHASAEEVQVWENNLAQVDNTLLNLRNAILADPSSTATVITSLYSTYGGRDPTAAEIAGWQYNIRAGLTYDAIRTAILKDALGQNHTTAVVDDLYRTYAGRAPTSGELAAAKAQLLAGSDFAAIRIGILTDPTVHAYELAQISQIYQAYGGRAPNADELAVWDNALRAGNSYDTVKLAVLGDPLGKTYVDGQIADAYQVYGGRAPNDDEIRAWENNLRGNGYDFGSVKSAILNDPLGQAYSVQAITTFYQRYGGRPPSAAEIQDWQHILLDGGTYDTLRHAILDDPLGRNYTASEVTALYLALAGRAPTTAEIETARSILGNGFEFAAVRSQMLSDASIHAHEIQQITIAYQTYGGRAPNSDELAVWHNALVNGASYDTIRDAILYDPLGHSYIDQQIIAAYQTYGGRSPSPAELTVWENALNGNNHDFAIVRGAILDDPIGQSHSATTISALYQQYFSRAPSSDEVGIWKTYIRNGVHFEQLQDVLLTDRSSMATTQRLSATPANDSLSFDISFHNALVTGFDSTHDTIDLRALDLHGVDLLDADHAQRIQALDGGTDTLITIDPTHHLLFKGIALENLHGADFLL